MYVWTYVHTPLHNRLNYISADLAHDSYGSLARGSSHLMLDQVEHVLIKEQPDEVEGPEAGCTPQGEVSYHHGAEIGEVTRGEVSCQQLQLLPFQCYEYACACVTYGHIEQWDDYL